MSTPDEITNNQDVIDSRDIIERIEYLEDLRTDRIDELEAQEELTEEEQKELDALRDDDPEDDTDYIVELRILSALKEDADGSPDWQYGETLIRDSYFAEYAEELCKDIGDLPKELPWYIANHIDWEGVAREIQMDYTSVDFDGVEYWIRA